MCFAGIGRCKVPYPSYLVCCAWRVFGAGLARKENGCGVVDKSSCPLKIAEGSLSKKKIDRKKDHFIFWS